MVEVVVVLRVEVGEEVRINRCDVRVDEIHGCILIDGTVRMENVS